jgi:hypothetical protein
MVNNQRHRRNEERAMKKILTLMLLSVLTTFMSPASAQIPPYGLYVMQGDVSGTFFWGRYWTPANPNANYIMMYDGATQIPANAALGSGLNWNGTTLAISAVPQTSIMGLAGSFAGKFDVPLGTTAQYVRGDGSLATLPLIPSRSFSYTARSLNVCFQPSSTRDVDATYSVDISTSLSLSGGAVGTVYLRTYTNSGCTAGTQEIARTVNGQTGTLTIGLALTQNVTGGLHGIVPAGTWAQLVTENTTGTPVFTARSAAEVQL